MDATIPNNLINQIWSLKINDLIQDSQNPDLELLRRLRLNDEKAFEKVFGIDGCISLYSNQKFNKK